MFGAPAARSTTPTGTPGTAKDTRAAAGAAAATPAEHDPGTPRPIRGRPPAPQPIRHQPPATAPAPVNPPPPASVLSRIGVPPLTPPAAAPPDRDAGQPATPPLPPARSVDEPAPATPRKQGRKLALTALAISLLALAGSGAVAVLLYRLNGSDPGSTAPQRPQSVAAQATTGLPVTYAKEPLDIRIGCAALVYLDLDEPRAGAAQQTSDLRYDSKCGNNPAQLSLGPGATSGAGVATADLNADDCRRAIRNGPLGPGAQVPVKKGSAICVLTAAQPAKLVLVEITDVGATGTAGLRATSWLARD
ncbi:hypothetical protein [Actinoplanes cyaneus]|uniref:hypothetical protein n=1 Tax=Actinoplanes cyaneus TaxID=52696 RepID=UPI0031DD2DC0